MARKKKKSSLSWAFVLSGIAAFAISMVVILFFGERFLPTGGTGTGGDPKKDTLIVSLYFTDKSGKGLVAEKRLIENNTQTVRLKTMLTALVAGPATKSLVNPIPRATRVISVEVKGNIAYVNLSRQFRDNHPGGSSAEMQAIYAIVDTVTLNSKIELVQILIEGKKTDTLAGHVMIGVPLGARRSIISG